MAIEHAGQICDWQENLTSDEMPPRWMWPFNEELEVYFEAVDRKRKEKYGIEDDDTGSTGDTSSGMMENEFARGRR